MSTLKEFSQRLDRFELRILARDSKKNRRVLKRFEEMEGVSVVWGDLMNKEDLRRGIEGVDYVLHMGGMVSPAADRYPEKTLKVNIGGTRNLVEVIKEQPDADRIGMVYVGSVAQMSDRQPPFHWGRTGDPMMPAVYDYYGVSKVAAEREVVESGLKKWVSLRQSGILHPGLFERGSNPITFHVPLQGVLEWATVEDSGRLMANICEEGVPEAFWNHFYNIGSGADYRLTNYEFECMILKAVGSPKPEKIFETDWFATRNFHGCWFVDSDKLESMVPFREKVPVEDYFRRMVKRAPKWVRLAPLAPPPVVKLMMKKVALSTDLGTLDWIGREDKEDWIEAFFGSREERDRIPGWGDLDLTRPSETPRLLDHGYDETKPESQLDIEDMRQAAAFRGGKCLSESMIRGDLSSPLEWECASGHKFRATPALVLLGGHWCKECSPEPWRYKEQRRLNPFMAQLSASEKL